MQKLFLLLSLSAFIAVCYAAPTKQEEELLAKVADILGAAQEESQAKANFFPSNAAHTSQLLSGRWHKRIKQDYKPKGNSKSFLDTIC